jgi:hypothetical protein
VQRNGGTRDAGRAVGRVARDGNFTGGGWHQLKRGDELKTRLAPMYEVDAGELGVKRVRAASFRDALELVFLPKTNLYRGDGYEIDK